ncbi:MAG: 30S ribosomal protein S12 methylthiotransferase RimO [Lachnospiraceae bacterium]|nr:30S ribosomal protein S12 methylthiotransferase RimO [Lachnospiraceae bacterium]
MRTKKKTGTKVLAVSLGCDKTRVDTEKMLGALLAHGYEWTDDESKAQAAVINTCCFIHDAKTESIREILRLAEMKKEGALRALVVCGCLSERYKEEILREIPEVDAVTGTASCDRIAQLLSDALSGKKTLLFEDINRSYKCAGRRITGAGNHVAYLKIAEGCNKRCTYCIIPSLRGRYRSVPEEELIEEAAFLAANGTRELVLVAQETTLYGLDLCGEKRLAHLLRRLAREVKELSYLRLLYCYPEEIDDALIDAIAEEEKIVPYLDMPVQSGSDRILKRMGRRTTNAEIRALVTKLRERIPGIALRTTFITGFPGEEAADHNETMALVRDLAFDRIGVFPFSREEGTPAFRMRGQVAEALKKRRRTEIMRLQQEISLARSRALIGETMEAIVEGTLTEEDRTVTVARTYRDAPEVDGYLFFAAKKEHMSGDRVRVRVTGADAYDLTGEEV